MAEKEARDFFREEWVEEPGTTISKVGLEEVVVLMETEEVVKVAGGYSGGGSSVNRVDACGGGGGSYNAGKNQQNECCYNTAGHGQVTITLI